MGLHMYLMQPRSLMLPFRALCVQLQRPPLYVTYICPTIFFEGIELFMGWMNVQTLERAPIPVFGKLARYSIHGHSFTRLWYIHIHIWCNNACSSQTYPYRDCSEMNKTCVWQSQVEIKHYSVAYFNHVTMFKTLQHRSSIWGALAQTVSICACTCMQHV